MSQSEETYFDSEPIIAWRGWRVIESDGRLKLSSITYQIDWEPLSPMCAECIHMKKKNQFISFGPQPKGAINEKDHGPAPNDKHSCGIYGLKSPSGTLRWASESVTKRTVIGTVSLWGRVLQHEEGYRAELAYPKFLFVIVENPKGIAGAPDYRFSVDETVEGLLSYGVPVETKWRHEIKALG